MLQTGKYFLERLVHNCLDMLVIGLDDGFPTIYKIMKSSKRKRRSEQFFLGMSISSFGFCESTRSIGHRGPYMLQSAPCEKKRRVLDQGGTCIYW